MARWNRAAGLLPVDARRVLDIGCAFGFGTRRLVRPGRTVVGIEVSAAYVRRAVRAGGGPLYLRGLGAPLPFRDGAFDAVVCLDVLEHVPDEAAVVAEIARVLRPGGTLIVSVPHRGRLARCDSINRLPDCWDMAEVAPGRDVATEPGEVHRHYSVTELSRLLGPRLHITAIRRSGFGVAELVNLPLLWLSKRVLRAPRLYDLLQYAYFTVYLAEDLIPTGRAGYHLMVRARRRR
jgi:SAM-dependent methyltransferase